MPFPTVKSTKSEWNPGKVKKTTPIATKRSTIKEESEEEPTSKFSYIKGENRKKHHKEDTSEEEDFGEDIRKKHISSNMMDILIKSIVETNKTNTETLINASKDAQKELLEHINSVSENHTKTNKEIIKYIKDSIEEQTENANRNVEIVTGGHERTVIDLTNGIESVIVSLIEKISSVKVEEDKKTSSIIKGWDESLAKSGDVIILAGPNVEVEPSLRNYRRYHGISNILENDDEVKE